MNGATFFVGPTFPHEEVQGALMPGQDQPFVRHPMAIPPEGQSARLLSSRQLTEAVFNVLGWSRGNQQHERDDVGD